MQTYYYQERILSEFQLYILHCDYKKNYEINFLFRYHEFFSGKLKFGKIYYRTKRLTGPLEVKS